MSRQEKTDSVAKLLAGADVPGEFVDQIAAEVLDTVLPRERLHQTDGLGIIFIAVNEQGHGCGHRHIYWDRAAICARSWERYYRFKYNERQLWTVVPIDLDKVVKS